MMMMMMIAAALVLIHSFHSVPLKEKAEFKKEPPVLLGSGKQTKRGSTNGAGCP